MPETLEQAQAAYSEILSWAAEQPEIVERETWRKLCREDIFFLLVFVLNRKDVVHPWVYQRARMVQNDPDGCLDVWARFHFKAVDLNEPVPTPDGWKNHGDLFVGDRVYGPDGKPTKVIARTEVFHDADCYRLTFCDGYSVVVSGDHLWTVQMMSKKRLAGERREKWKTVTLNTRDLATEVARCAATPSRRFPCVPVAAPVGRPKVNLPLDPYVLGVWLGDGTTGCAGITSGLADADEMESLLRATGISVSRARHSNCVSLRVGSGIRGKRGTSDVRNALRALGIIHKKAIPEQYLLGSEDQRWALLQGLMDTDGNCSRSSSQCSFSNANEKLAYQVFDLCQSLGLKATINPYTVGYKGERRPFWAVQFRGYADRPPFRFKRKAALCWPAAKYRRSERRVMAVDRVDSRPVSCIQVDRADGLYLIGRHYVATHNSTLITFALTIQDILKDPECTFCIFSNTSPLARQFLRQIKTEFEDNGRLKSLFDDILWSDPEKMAAKWSEHEGIIVKRRSNPKEATIEAFGLIDNQPTSKHFSHRVYDDVVTQESVGNVDTIKKTTERWELSIATGQGGGRNVERYVGTFYHGNDTYQEIMRRGVVKVRRFPGTEDGTADGIPVLMGQEELMKLGRSMGPATFAMQVLLDVKGGSTRSFRPEWLRWWSPKRAGLNVYIIVDPSSGKKRYRGGKAQNDYTSMLVFGIDGNNNRMVIDLVRDRLNLDGRTNALFALHRKYRPVQQVGYEETGMQADIEHIQYVMKEQNYRFDITPLGTNLAKSDVIESALPYFANGQVYLPEDGINVVNSEGRAEDVIQTFLTEEYNLYPVCKHDDTLNCFGHMSHPDIRLVPPNFDYSKRAAHRERIAARRQRSLMAL